MSNGVKIVALLNEIRPLVEELARVVQTEAPERFQCIAIVRVIDVEAKKSSGVLGVVAEPDEVMRTIVEAINTMGGGMHAQQVQLAQALTPKPPKRTGSPRTDFLN